MTTTPLILKGNCKIGADAGGAVDFSDTVYRFIIAGDADEIEIPATLANPKGVRPGGVKYTVTIEYMSNDTSLTAELFSVFWTALTTDAATPLYFEGTMRDAAASATNPKWSGNFYVTHAALGGDAEGLSTDSVTFTLTAAPTRATS